MSFQITPILFEKIRTVLPKLVILLISFSLLPSLNAQDTNYIKVHFLYGSKPLREFRETESKWFGGILGGHVGIESDSNRILNFLPSGEFHWIAKKKNRHSTFDESSENEFYGILGGHPDSNKSTIVYIPVTNEQKAIFDSISQTYLQNTPYDYAFIGMRCGAASYDILANMEIVPQYQYRKTYRKIFYPKKLRKRLLKKAHQNNWKIEQQEGTVRRKWEQD